MLAGERPTFTGEYYKVTDAMAEPRFRDHIPLMIGGSGEKKTIPLAAKHFDHLNIIAGFDELPRKVQVVKESCEKIDRDPATLETSMLVMALIDDKATDDMIPDDLKRRRRSAAQIRSSIRSRPRCSMRACDGVILSPVTSLSGYHPGGITAGGRKAEAAAGGLNTL